MKTNDRNYLTYCFKLKDATFHTIKTTTKSYTNKIEQLWKEYDVYPEMSNKANTIGNDNEKLLEEFKKLGVFKIEIIKNVFGTIFPTILYDIAPALVINQEDLDRIKFFEEFKANHKYIGLFWGLNEINHVAKLDWLPVPNRSMRNSVNLIQYQDNIWLVIFDGVTHVQSLLIGSDELFYNEDEFFSGQKLIEVEEILPDSFFKNIIAAFEIFYVARYKYFFGEHPWLDILEPDYEPDTRAIFLIWLFRLQEQISKLKEQIDKGKTILFTFGMNDLNNKFVEYNITYTPEIQQEILSKKESMKLYAIVNDYFIN